MGADHLAAWHRMLKAAKPAIRGELGRAEVHIPLVTVDDGRGPAKVTRKESWPGHLKVNTQAS